MTRYLWQLGLLLAVGSAAGLALLPPEDYLVPGFLVLMLGVALSATGALLRLPQHTNYRIPDPTPGELPNGWLERIKPNGEKVQTIGKDDGLKLHGPNDMVLDEGGGVFFSTSGTWDYLKQKEEKKPEGKVYYVTPGLLKVYQRAEGIYYANGVAIIKKKSLLVAETFNNRILKYEIGDVGALKYVGVWMNLSNIEPTPEGFREETGGPDGLEVDSIGRVYLCQFGASRIIRANPDGTLDRIIPVPLSGVTNVALGRKEQELYVTAVKEGPEPYLGAVDEIPNP